jgi:hypothetical protein
MRTKTLLLTAALAAAGALSSMAQSNVYSLNIVGYVNLTLTNGFNAVANPLDSGSNTIQNVFSTNLPNGSVVYKFSGGGFNNFYSFARGSWSGDASLNPGESVMVLVPSATTVTTVGNVLTGTNSNPNLVTGYSLIGSQVPISGGIQTTLGYNPTTGDVVYSWDPAAQAWDPFIFGRGGWGPSEPVISPGEGFFLLTGNATPSWTEVFTPQ